MIDSLVQKPQAFRYSQFREHLLPSPDYRRIGAYADEHLAPHKACRYTVRRWHLAASEHCEETLGRCVLAQLDGGELNSKQPCRQRFSPPTATIIPIISPKQYPLNNCDQRLTSQEVNRG